MDPVNVESTARHVVAMPYPGRGHINPMMNLCHLLASQTNHTHIRTLITFVVTEEWFDIIGSDSKPANISFATIPNVLPSERVRGAEFLSFIEAVMTKMEEPFEQLLLRLQPPVNVIIADTFLGWAVNVGNRRNIPVASLWPMPASVFSIYYHFDLLLQNNHFPIDELSERGNERVDYIPGLSSMCVADLPKVSGQAQQALPLIRESISSHIHRAQYLLIASIYEIEAPVIDNLKAKIPLPIYSFGPAIPYLNLQRTPSNSNTANYFKWLDSQPQNSVLYISLGSFLPVSSAQMDEIAAGLSASGVRYLWVARGETSRLKEVYCGGVGLMVPWCDQLRVLCHPSIGGFWTHCGWNSIMESVFAGKPMLAFPIRFDQIPNSKFIVEDWKIGWKVRRDVGMENLVKGEEISGIVQRFMDLEKPERKEMTIRTKEFQETCLQSIAKGGSSETHLESFVRDISQYCDV